ncbi:MAG: GNAT family N-acetyltransferase, partial [Deltaproteobacteria bacterium]
MKEGEVVIRRIRATDLDRVRTLADRALKEEYSQDLMSHLYERFGQGFIMAESDGDLLGFVLGIPLDEGTMRILMFAVDETMRRRGVGTLLMESLRRYALRRRMRVITLEVAVDNKEAQEFYRRMGFAVAGMIP